MSPLVDFRSWADSIHLNFFVSFFNTFHYFVKSLTKELIIRITM